MMIFVHLSSNTAFAVRILIRVYDLMVLSSYRFMTNVLFSKPVTAARCEGKCTAY